MDIYNERIGRRKTHTSHVAYNKNKMNNLMDYNSLQRKLRDNCQTHGYAWLYQYSPFQSRNLQLLYPKILMVHVDAP